MVESLSVQLLPASAGSAAVSVQLDARLNGNLKEGHCRGIPRRLRSTAKPPVQNRYGLIQMKVVTKHDNFFF